MKSEISIHGSELSPAHKTELDQPHPSSRALAKKNWADHARDLPLRIEYNQTQIAKVSFELLRENRIIAALEPGNYSNAYKFLRAQVLHSMRQNNWNTLGITSPGKGEGKSLTAVNFAISLALEVNYTVLLIDANLRNPSIDKYLGINAIQGLSDCLTDGIPVEELLIHPSGIDRFVILPGGRPLLNAGEMLSSHMMIRFINEVKERYPSRIVIFDLPPVLVAGEALAVSPYLDANLLVVEAGKTKRDDILRSESLLVSSNVLGTVLSKSQ